MNKRAFLLSLLFMTIISIVVSSSCMAVVGGSGSSGTGLTILYDSSGNPTDYSSNITDAGYSSAINYRTTVASFDVDAYPVSDPTCVGTPSEVGPHNIAAPAYTWTDVTTYTGALPEDIKSFLDNHTNNYCKITLHPRVEAYFNSISSYMLPSAPFLNNFTQKYFDGGSPGTADDLCYYQLIGVTQADCTNLYNLYNSAGDHSSYSAGNTAHDSQDNGVIEYYDQLDGVYGSYIGWSSLDVFAAINSRFQNAIEGIIAPIYHSKIDFHNWTEPTITAGANTIPFQYIITLSDAANLSRGNDFSVALTKLNASGNFTPESLSPAESPFEGYFNPTDVAPGNGRGTTCNILTKDTPYPSSFQLDTTSLSVGTYNIAFCINASSGIEAYEKARHRRDITFTKNSDGSITQGGASGLNLAINSINVTGSFTPGNTYTATVDYTVTGTFPAGAKVAAYLNPPSSNLTSPDEYAAGTTDTGTGRSLLATAPLNEGNYNFTFSFNIPSTYTGTSFTLRAEIIPEVTTPPVVESIPYNSNPALSDNVKELPLTLYTVPTPSTNYLQLTHIIPATEQIGPFTDQVRVRAYYVPTGGGASGFNDVSWDPSTNTGGIDPNTGSAVPSPFSPIMKVKSAAIAGTTTLCSNNTYPPPVNFTLTCSNTGGASTVASQFITPFDYTFPSSSQDLSCQTDPNSGTGYRRNILYFGLSPYHHHVAPPCHGSSHGSSNGPSEGGCTAIGTDP